MPVAECGTILNVKCKKRQNKKKLKVTCYIVVYLCVVAHNHSLTTHLLMQCNTAKKIVINKKVISRAYVTEIENELFS